MKRIYYDLKVRQESIDHFITYCSVLSELAFNFLA